MTRILTHFQQRLGVMWCVCFNGGCVTRYTSGTCLGERGDILINAIVTMGRTSFRVGVRCQHLGYSTPFTNSGIQRVTNGEGGPWFNCYLWRGQESFSTYRGVRQVRRRTRGIHHVILLEQRLGNCVTGVLYGQRLFCVISRTRGTLCTLNLFCCMTILDFMGQRFKVTRGPDYQLLFTTWLFNTPSGYTWRSRIIDRRHCGLVILTCVLFFWSGPLCVRARHFYPFQLGGQHYFTLNNVWSDPQFCHFSRAGSGGSHCEWGAPPSRGLCVWVLHIQQCCIYRSEPGLYVDPSLLHRSSLALARRLELAFVPGGFSVSSQTGISVFFGVLPPLPVVVPL